MTTNGKVTRADLQGAKKVTCKEAAKLLREGKVTRAWFRPDGVINLKDSDNDPAYVWTS